MLNLARELREQLAEGPIISIRLRRYSSELRDRRLVGLHPPGFSTLPGAFQEVTADHPQRQRATQEESRLAPGELLRVIDEPIQIMLPKIAGQPLDLLSASLSRLCDVALALLAQLLPGLSKHLRQELLRHRAYRLGGSLLLAFQPRSGLLLHLASDCPAFC